MSEMKGLRGKDKERKERKEEESKRRRGEKIKVAEGENGGREVREDTTKKR